MSTARTPFHVLPVVLLLVACGGGGASPETLASLGSGFTQGLRVDATSVYWGTMDLGRTGGIRRFAR